jgi:preprotein translocase subunit Sss1
MVIVVVALGLLVTLRPGSAEFSITVLTLFIGLAFIGMIAFFVRVIGR